MTASRTLAVGLILLLPGLLALDALAETPVPHHEVEVILDPGSGAVELEQTLSGAAGPVRFEPAGWLSIVEARLGGEALPLDGGGLALPGGALEGRALELRLRGTVPGAGEGEQAALASPEGGYLFGDAGWLPESGTPRQRHDVTIRVPEGYRAVATGRLVAERLTGGGYEASFRHQALGEAPSIFFGPYAITEEVRDGVRLRTYFHPEDGHLAGDYLDAAAAHITRFRERIGDYPYEGFSIVSAPTGVGLGFDSLTYVGRRILPHPYMRGRSLAHEILHSWWGNAVGVDYATGNWAEGLTTYMADHALAEDRGEGAAREMRLEWLRNLAALPPGQRVPVRSFRAKTHDAAQVVGYDKIALIFHMLRREVGEDAFQAALRAFWGAHRFGRAGWDDLRTAFEQASGRRLDWFFGQWLERPGLPRVTLEAAGVERTGSRYRLEIALAQAARPYRLMLPVLIETERGTEQVELSLTGERGRFERMLEAAPVAVRVDPEFEVARALLPGESAPILRDVTLSAETALLVPAEDADLRSRALALSATLLHREPEALAADAPAPGNRPLLAVGSTGGVAALRERALPGAPAGIAHDGTARAWVEAGADGQPWMFVSADDAEDLGGALMGLRYYGNRSFVVLEGGKVSAAGVWPAADSPLAARLDAGRP